MLKKILDGLLEQPLLTSILVMDFGVLIFHRPPFFFSLIMLGALVGISMYLGQKLSLFKI